MERFDKYKLDDLKTWKKLSWLTTICYGFYCLSLIFNTLLEDVSENVDAMNESNLPLYILFFVIAMHSISITLIYRVQMFQALIAIVYRALSSGHRDRTSVAAGITIVDFQKRPCASARASQSNFLAWWPSAPRLRPPCTISSVAMHHHLRSSCTF